jgi:ATP-dependent DNA helicase RecQ
MGDGLRGGDRGAEAVLRNVFGHTGFRGPQAEIVDHVIGGGDALVLMPTGGGKSLCFQLPALILPGVGVVVSPLIALMRDQVDGLRRLGVRAAALNSSLDWRDAADLEREMAAGALDLVYVAPERLTTPRFLELLDRTPLALFALDEAHCVSQWGHDFRPEYRQLSILAERYPGVPRLALTATADARTRADIVDLLRLDHARAFVTSFDRPNIAYHVEVKTNPRDQLWAFLEPRHRQNAGIVYCLTRQRVEEVATWLSDQGRLALPYHAGLPAAEREANQDRFLAEPGVIVVATIAFGMGIDKPNVRFVAHLDLPRSLEAYYQETGRAGRDGQAADAWMAYGMADVVLLRRRLEESPAPDAQKRIEQTRLQALLGFCESPGCRRRALLDYFGERLDQPCGNCDTCRSPGETWDASVAAQKALAAVYRTGQRFGAGHLIDVLRGEATDKVLGFGHEQIRTFGVGTELSSKEWRSVYRQLMALGLLTVDPEGQGFRLTEDAWPVLKGEQALHLRRDPGSRTGRALRAGRSGATAKAPAGYRPGDEGLLETLKKRRAELAREQGVPAYVVFHDATLIEMAERRPADRAAFAALPGVGARKLDRYADTFLDLIRAAR